MGEISQSVKVNGVRAQALLDSGATENYISKRLAKRLRLYNAGDYAFQGISKVRHKGFISGVWISVMHRGGSTRVIATDLLPQDGYDVILGQPFLQDNEVKIDYAKDKFKYSNHQPRARRIGRI
jgi:hypothetical protein